jgi:hypothetical protein
MSKVNWLKTIVYNFLVFVVVLILGTNTLTLLLSSNGYGLDLSNKFVIFIWDTFGHSKDPNGIGAMVLTQFIFIPIISFIMINLGYYLVTKKSIFRKY